MATPTQSIKWIIKMALSKIGFVTLVVLDLTLFLFGLFVDSFSLRSWFLFPGYREFPFEEFQSSKVLELQQYQTVLTVSFKLFSQSSPQIIKICPGRPLLGPNSNSKNPNKGKVGVGEQRHNLLTPY